MGKKKDTADDDLEDRKLREKPLQAVLLADDWHGFTPDPYKKWGFQPLLLDRRPKVLFPLLDRPMIDYAISYLASQNVQELYIMCVTQAVEDYVNESTSLQKLAMKVVVIRDVTVTNAGDALRELDKRSVIESDPFVLMHGDTVTNCDLSKVIEAHKQRRKADNTAILTMLLKEALDQRPCMDDLIVGVDPLQSNRILLYGNNIDSSKVAVPCSFYTSHCTSLLVYTNLIDVGIDLCSPDVLARFSDEFDYRDIRSQFVANSVAEEEEGLQNKLFAHLMQGPSEYASCCTDLRTFHQTSRDILRRSAYPVVPMVPLQKRNYMYLIESDVRMGRSSTIVGPGLLGASVVVGEHCTVTGSVVCNHSHIGDGCVITDSHLWEGVQVEANATIEKSILGAGVVVGPGAKVSRGCVIGAGCIVGAKVTLPEYTRLTCSAFVSEDDDDEDWDESSEEEEGDTTGSPGQAQAGVSEADVVGQDGVGRVWKPNEDDIDEDFFLAPALIMQSQSIGFDAQQITSQKQEFQAEILEDLDSEDDDSFGEGALQFGAGSPSIVGRQAGVDVIKELKAICMEYESSSPIENLAIELNSYKFSQNASYSDCTLAATLAIIENMDITESITDGKLVSEFKILLGIWKPLLQKMSIGLEEEKAIIVAIQQCAVSEDLSPILSTGMSFRFLLQTLHDQEVVSEESIISWASDPSSESKLVEMQPVQDFIEWLQDDDDDDDGESSDESE